MQMKTFVDATGELEKSRNRRTENTMTKSKKGHKGKQWYTTNNIEN